MSTSNRSRTRLLAAGAVVVLLAVIGLIVTRDDGGDDDRRPGERLGQLDASGAQAVERWNATVDELEAGDRLGDLEWTLDESLGLEQAQQGFDTWGVVDLYRQPGGRLKAVDLVGEYTSDADRLRFRADAIAALAAADGLDADDAAELLDQELGLADPAAPPTTQVDRRGLRLVVERSATQAELRITAS